MVSKSKIATFRLPDDLTQEIRSRAEATGRDRTAVVVEALKQSFGISADDQSPTTVTELQQEIDKLEQKISKLSHRLSKLTNQSHSRSQTSDLSIALKQTVVREKFLSVASSFVSGNNSRTQTIGLMDGGGRPSTTATSPERRIQLGSGNLQETELQELEARIAQQSRIFDQVLSACPDPICVLDRMGRLTYVNLAMAQLFGSQQNQILGKGLLELDIPKEVMESLDAQREVVFATKRPLTFEISYPTINGNRDYECILSPILTEGSNLDAVICTARDITERNQVEEFLRESEANYRHLFEYANDSIFIIDLLSSRILDANQNASRRLGYTRKELLNLRTRDIDVPIAEERQRVISQQMQETGSFIFEHALRRKDGTEIQVEISSRVIEYQDRLVSLSFVRDISERKRSEERLRLLESAFFHANDGILITEAEPIDEPGPKIVYVNQGYTRMTGYQSEEVIGKTPRILQGDHTNQAQLDEIRAKLYRRESVRAELVDYRKDGSEFWVELNIVPIFDQTGWYTHWVAVQRDITERKRTEIAWAEREREQAAQLARANTLLHLEIGKHERTAMALRKCEEQCQLGATQTKAEPSQTESSEQ